MYKLAPSLKFKNDSEIQQFMKKLVPDELAVLDDLPSLAAMNGAFQGNSQLLLEMNTILGKNACKPVFQNSKRDWKHLPSR